MDTSGSHKLFAPLSFYYAKKASAVTLDSYLDNLQALGTVSTVEDFWAYYSHMARPHQMPPFSEAHLFLHTIKPMWEDPQNERGGRWIIRVKKSVTSRAWEDLCLALAGGQFDGGCDVCGVMVSLKHQDDALSVWNKDAENRESILKIREVMKQVLDIPTNSAFIYKAHNQQLDAQIHEQYNATSGL